MIDVNEVKAEIQRLENGKTTYSACEKLSVLYSICDHMDAKPDPMPEYSYASEKSEFIKSVSQAPFDRVLEVLDEHFEAVKILYPKEYKTVLNRIQSL